MFLVLVLQKHKGAVNYSLLWQGQTYDVKTGRLRVPRAEAHQQLDVKHWALKVAWKMSLRWWHVECCHFLTWICECLYSTSTLLYIFSQASCVENLAVNMSWCDVADETVQRDNRSICSSLAPSSITDSGFVCLIHHGKVNTLSQNCWNNSFLNAITSMTLLANCSPFLW